jgi:hypothetical protein
MKWNEAQAKLGECEADLRRLLAEAAGAGDYASVMRITDWARAVAALVAEGGPLPVMGSGAANAAPAKSGATAAPAPSGGRKARGKADEYPRFYRRGDELVKVGWSRKERKEYNHRAGRRAIDAVGAAVRQLGAKGRMFTGDKLLPLHDPADGSRIADYQAYVALAWLKHLGIVEQHGRKAGYTLVPDKQIDSIVTAAWPELAEWRG